MPKSCTEIHICGLKPLASCLSYLFKISAKQRRKAAKQNKLTASYCVPYTLCYCVAGVCSSLSEREREKGAKRCSFVSTYVTDD